jgi:hypothetical protein
MHILIDKLVEVLSAVPNEILPSGRLGSRQPSAGADLPAVVLSLSLQTVNAPGIGRVVRSGDSLVETKNVVEVKPSTDTFASDLESLLLSPLPLKKNPSSVAKGFTSTDIQVRNVTDLSSLVDYNLVNKPAKKEEYKLDPTRAQIVFGKAQILGEKLEVTHWTLTWRDEVLGSRYCGSVALEVWTDSFNQTDQASRKLQDKLKSQRSLLREKGFISLKPVSLGPAENLLQAAAVGTPFPVWKQRLEYKFAFEAEDGGELSSGVPIKRIDVGVDDYLVESFSIP